MANLRLIIHGELADVGIVISSSWRSTQWQLDEVAEKLGAHDVNALVDATAVSGFGGSRSDEILGWLEEHPRIRSWVVLDDMDLSVPHGARFTSQVVRTDMATGLTGADAECALAILRRSVDDYLPRARRGR